jgi:hypothetical protein
MKICIRYALRAWIVLLLLAACTQMPYQQQDLGTPTAAAELSTQAATAVVAVEAYPMPANTALPYPLPGEPYPAPIDPALLPTVEPPVIIAEQEFTDFPEAEQAAGFSIQAVDESQAGLIFVKALTRQYEGGPTLVTLIYKPHSETAEQDGTQVLLTQIPYPGNTPSEFLPVWFGKYAGHGRIANVQGWSGFIFGPEYELNGDTTSFVWAEHSHMLKITLSGEWPLPGDNPETLDDTLLKIANSLVLAETISWQTYTDPQQQYSLRLPQTWQPEGEEGHFSGADGFLQTAYLPEMAFMDGTSFMDGTFRLCERLANTADGPVYQIGAYSNPRSRYFVGCTLSALSQDRQDRIRMVVPNPQSDPSLRYFYIETDQQHFEQIAGSLKPPDYPSSDASTIGQLSTAWRPEDELFWGSPLPVPPELTIEEYAVGSSEVGSWNTIQIDYPLLEQALEKRAPWRDAPESFKDRRLRESNQLLKPFDYSIKRVVDTESETYSIYQGEQLILDRVSTFYPPSVNASGDDFILVADVISGGFQEVGMNRLIPLDMHPLHIPPVFHGDEYLTVSWDFDQDQLLVEKDRKRIYAYSAHSPAPWMKRLWSWEGHWMLEIDGFLIQDGENQNEVLDYEEIFGWQLLDGKPIYFFRKGPRLGVSYDGQILPVFYEFIPHYACCEIGYYNPAGNERMAWFYGWREGTWYYVEIGNYN